MFTAKKLALVSLFAVTTAGPGLAAADHRRDVSHLQLGDVSTHPHDTDDSIALAPARRLEQIQLKGRGAPVALAGVRVHFANGSEQFADLERLLRPGESIMIDIANRKDVIESVVLEYGSAGKVRPGRDTAHVQVLGFLADGRRESRWQQLAGRDLIWPTRADHDAP